MALLLLWEETPSGASFYSLDGGTGVLPLISIEIDVTNPPTSSLRTWTGVTQYVRSCSFTRSGRNDEFQRTAPGTCTLVLDNRGDAITTLAGAVNLKAQWMHVLSRWGSTTYELWKGVITSAPRQWPAYGYDATLTVQAADSLYLLRLYDLFGSTFPAQRTDQRISAILNLVQAAGVGGTFNLSGTLDTQSDTVDAILTPLGLGSDALSQLLALEASDNGLVVSKPDGTIDYQGRHWRLLNSTSSVVTLDEAAGVNYQDSVTYEDDDSRLANIVTVTPAGGGTPQTASDAASQASFWARHNQSVDRTLLTSGTATALSAAQWLLARYKNPPPRIPTVSFDLTHGGSSMAAILGLANSQRVTWKRQATTPINVDGYVEQIQHTILPGTRWTMALQLSPALASLEWVLGHAVNGQLGVTTGLSY